MILLAMILSSFVTTSISDRCNHSGCEECLQENMGTKVECRWCPLDNTCYSPNDIPVSLCQNVGGLADVGKCTGIRNSNSMDSSYNPALSLKMLMLSSASYAKKDPQGCLSNALPKSNFTVTSVATRKCDMVGDQCSAIVAVSHVEKAIALAFRGSTDMEQVCLEMLETLAWPKEVFLGGEVEKYWKTSFDTLWGCVQDEVKVARQQYPSYKVWVTGHSLGATVASLASAYIVANGIAPLDDVISYTFGQPRVGDVDYANRHDQLVNNSWRVVNSNDLVPHFPTQVSLGHDAPHHHGVEVYYQNVTTKDPNVGYKECHGKPLNEDASCSASAHFPYSVAHHKYYFNIEVGTHCDDVHNTQTSSGGGTGDAGFDYLADQCSVYKVTGGKYKKV